MLDFVGLRAPRLTSIENCMKLSQMVVQGLQEAKSPLLQLPHFEEEHLRYCISKKVHLVFDTSVVMQKLFSNLLNMAHLSSV